MKKIEYAIQVRNNGCFVDKETFNERNCKWDIPIENWFERIRDDEWFFGRIRRRFKSARIVKRTTTEEVLFKGSEAKE